MRLVLATPEAINFQWGRVINIGGKKSSKKGPTGPENKVNKRAFLRPKWLPKWTPEASRNVCTRRSATEAAKNAFWGAPRTPPDDFGAIFLPHRYPRIIRGLSGPPNFAHLGPWERTRIKEIDLKQLKHRIRHASGRWPGEFWRLRRPPGPVFGAILVVILGAFLAPKAGSLNYWKTLIFDDSTALLKCLEVTGRPTLASHRSSNSSAHSSSPGGAPPAGGARLLALGGGG